MSCCCSLSQAEHALRVERFLRSTTVLWTAGTARSCFTAWRGAHEDAKREAERLRREEALSAQHAHTPRMLNIRGVRE